MKVTGFILTATNSKLILGIYIQYLTEHFLLARCSVFVRFFLCFRYNIGIMKEIGKLNLTMASEMFFIQGGRASFTQAGMSGEKMSSSAETRKR